MLVTAELSAAAGTLRLASRSLQSRIDDTSSHSHALTSTGLAGPAAEAGLAALKTLGRRFEEPADRLTAVAGILESAAGAQAALDRAMEMVGAFSAMPLPTPGLLPGVPNPAVLHRSTIAALNILARTLDKACAAAVADACLLEHEADLDRLIFHPDEPLDRIHARHMATAPASVQEVVTGANGVILESGPTGHTVMVGPPGADLDASSPHTLAPSSVTTMVAGVSSGDPAKLPGQIAQAQSVAAATGGPVIVWQGYAPPPGVVAGVDPSSARAGADDLSAFQLALDERFPDAKKIVVGHSYGTVVATRAAMDHGLHADELVLAGSPGVPSKSVDELTLHSDNPRVSVADSPADPILATRGPQVAAHGFNPAAPGFGAERITGVRGNHTDYFGDDAFLGAMGERARR